MKKNHIIVLIIIGLTNLTACSDWLDINTSPNTATKVEPEVLFGYATASWAGNACGGDSWLPLGFAGQTLSTGGDFGWGDVNVYDISPYSTGNTWKAYIPVIGTNLKTAIKFAETSIVKQPYIAAQCKFMFAQCIYELTTIYGDVPYSESWQDDISTPKFDSQESVLNAILKLLDEALDDAKTPENPNLKVIKEYDIIYNGNMEKWIRFGNSLKLKIAMLMVDSDPSKAELIGKMLQEEQMISSAAENFKIPFYDEPNKENPKFKILKKYANKQNLFFFANSNVVDIMSPLADPRLEVYFEPGKNAGGKIIGVGTNNEADETTAFINMKTLYKPDAPYVVYTYQELLFFKAEAYARGLGVAKDLAKADEFYKKAVTEALKYHDISKDEIDIFIAKLPDLKKVADPVKEIHLQQWIDLMDRTLDAFTQWRRSGPEGHEVPRLVIPNNASQEGLFRRFEYSPDEATANPNTPKDIKFYHKMWFDK